MTDPSATPAGPAPLVRPVRFRHHLEELLLRGVAGGVGVLPEGWATALGGALGWVAGGALGIRRRVIEDNLRRAFPDRDPRWIRATAVESMRHLGREGVSILRLDRLGADAIRARTELVGEAHLTGPLSEGRGVLLVSGHFGNWEIGGAAVASRGYPIDGVARAQNNPLFDARLNATRERVGMRVVDRRGSTKTLLRSLRDGRVVALVADQNVQSAGVFIPFFGIPASTARGPALLASRTGAALVFAAAIRCPGSEARYRVELEPIHPPPPDAEDPDRFILERYLAHLERVIRDYPEQYLWAHRRWKTRPHDETEEPPHGGAVLPGDPTPQGTP
jgi:Kdo2-lipid IVA lauroyltransferase/acyltransferase